MHKRGVWKYKFYSIAMSSVFLDVVRYDLHSQSVRLIRRLMLAYPLWFSFVPQVVEFPSAVCQRQECA